MTTIAPRVFLSHFALANPLYAEARLYAYVADVSTGRATTTLATLYRAPTGTEEEANPFRLDGDGKLTRPVYVDGPVVVRAHPPGSTPVHDTGVLGLTQRFRGEWEAAAGSTATAYQVGDIVRDGANGSDTGYLYICAEAHSASAIFADDLTAGLWVLYVTGGTGGDGGDGIDVVGTTSVSAGTSSANYIKITGNTTGNPPLISALGSDATISIRLVPKGSAGTVQIRDRLEVGRVSQAGGAVFYGPFAASASGDNRAFRV